MPLKFAKKSPAYRFRGWAGSNPLPADVRGPLHVQIRQVMPVVGD